MKERIGLIDIGSNSIRLVVFQIENNLSISEIQNIKMPARIYQYINSAQEMSEEGISTLIDILHAFDIEAKTLNVNQMLVKTTAAIRQSKNQKRIIQQVKEETGLTLSIVSEQMEAFYGFNAITHSIANSDGVSIDIGGGSTEITHFKDKKVVQAHSFPFGAVSLQETFFADKAHNDKKAIQKTRAYIREQFLSHPFMVDLNLPIVAVGGSARNVTRVHQNHINYPLAGLHHYEMSPQAIDAVGDIFAQSSMKALKKMDGLSSERADIITPATLVFQELIHIVGAPQFIFSQRGLREGILYEYLEENYPKAFDSRQTKRQTVERMTQDFSFEMTDNAQRMHHARLLLHSLSKNNHFHLAPHEEEWLEFGAYLYQFGQRIETGNASQHTFYMLSNTNLNGFTHKDRIALSLIASFKNKTLFKTYVKPFKSWFTTDEIERLQSIGGIIKFAECLNNSHANIIHALSLTPQKTHYRLDITYSGLLTSEIHRCDSQKKHIERILNSDLDIHFQALPH